MATYRGRVIGEAAWILGLILGRNFCAIQVHADFTQGILLCRQIWFSGTKDAQFCAVKTDLIPCAFFGGGGPSRIDGTCFTHTRPTGTGICGFLWATLITICGCVYRLAAIGNSGVIIIEIFYATSQFSRSCTNRGHTGGINAKLSASRRCFGNDCGMTGVLQPLRYRYPARCKIRNSFWHGEFLSRPTVNGNSKSVTGSIVMEHFQVQLVTVKSELCLCWHTAGSPVDISLHASWIAHTIFCLIIGPMTIVIGKAVDAFAHHVVINHNGVIPSNLYRKRFSPHGKAPRCCSSVGSGCLICVLTLGQDAYTVCSGGIGIPLCIRGNKLRAVDPRAEAYFGTGSWLSPFTHIHKINFTFHNT